VEAQSIQIVWNHSRPSFPDGCGSIIQTFNDWERQPQDVLGAAAGRLASQAAGTREGSASVAGDRKESSRSRVSWMDEHKPDCR